MVIGEVPSLVKVIVRSPLTPPFGVVGASAWATLASFHRSGSGTAAFSPLRPDAALLRSRGARDGWLAAPRSLPSMRTDWASSSATCESIRTAASMPPACFAFIGESKPSLMRRFCRALLWGEPAPP